MRYFLVYVAVLATGVLKAQVSLQTGSANYGVPLFSFSDAKSGLSTAISLSYSSGSGLVVNSVAPNTGVGWNLVVGGSIVRKQVGEPDDQNSETLFPKNPNGYTNVNGHNQSVALVAEQTTEASEYVGYYYPNGFMYSEFPVDISANTPLTYAAPREVTFMPRFREAQYKSWKSSRRSLADREQDVFIYNFNGNSGQFVIGKDGSILQVNDTKMKIEKFTNDLTNQNIRTRITEFRFTDLTGIVYKFNAYELTEVMGIGQNQVVVNPLLRTQTYEPSGKYTIQKWVLTEIYNPLTQQSIYFEYQDYEMDLLTDKMVSCEEVEGPDGEWVVNTTMQRSHQKAKRISRVVMPNGYKVEFSYNNSIERVDVPNDFPLATIKAFYGNESTPYFTYELVYGYFFKTEVKDYNFAFTGADRRFTRLCLKSIQKKGRDISEPPYKFSYYTGAGSTDFRDIVPPRLSLATDMWGYYNKSDFGDIGDTTEAAVDLYAHMTQLLPYRSIDPGSAKFGLLKSIENPLGGTLTFEYEQNQARLIDNPTSVFAAPGVRVSRSIVKDESNNEIATSYVYNLADGTSSGWGYEGMENMQRRQIRIWNASAPAGYIYEGRMYKDVSSAGSPFLVKEMSRSKFGTFLNALGAMLYEHNKDDMIFFIVSGLVERIFILFDPTEYKWLRSYSWFPKTAHNPIGIHYSRVEVKNTSLSGGMGKVVNEFTRPADVNTEIGVLQFPYSSKQRFAYWKYDLPLKVQTYNQAGVLLTETVNEYDVYETSSTSDNHKSCKVEANIFNSAACDAATSGIDVSDIASEIYYVKTGRVELKKITEKNISPTVISERDNLVAYNTDYLSFTSTGARSNGDKLISKIYYTNDYDNISIAIQSMKTANMLAVPIATETWLKKVDGSEYLVDGSINEYVVLNNGEIKLKRVYGLETRQPIPQSVIGSHRRDILVPNTTYYKEKLINEYNADGNLSESKTPEGKVSSYLYDYNKRLVVAQVVNAGINQVAYSSFESDVKGGWNYSDSYIEQSITITGSKSFKYLDASALITGLMPDNKTYILSFWAKGERIPYVYKDSYSNGVLTPLKTYVNTVTGWTYYEYNVSGAGTIYLNGRPSRVAPANCNLDELRLYPADGEMATTAYNPVFGPTATCDVNNRLVYYEFDNLGRKKLVRDEKYNIIETFEYHYKNQ